LNFSAPRSRSCTSIAWWLGGDPTEIRRSFLAREQRAFGFAGFDAAEWGNYIASYLDCTATHRPLIEGFFGKRIIPVLNADGSRMAPEGS
jgi:hypothetical protein